MANGKIKMMRRTGAEAIINLNQRRDWFVDVTQTPANVLGNAGSPTIKKIAGATLIAGDVVYEDGTNGMKTALADVVATAGVVGICQNGGADNQPVTVQTGGIINVGATLTLGETYVLSAANAGKIAPVGDIAGTNSPTILGVAISTSLLQLSINVSGILHA